MGSRSNKEHESPSSVKSKDPTYEYVKNYLAMKNMKGPCMEREWQQFNFPPSYSYALNQQDRARVKVANHVNIHLQHLSDSDGESTSCWTSIQKVLCGCCLKPVSERAQRNTVRERQREEERIRDMRRKEKEQRQMELQRKRKKEAREQEMKKEEAERMERLNREVLQEWARAISQQSWRLTNEEMRDLKRLRKMEKTFLTAASTDVESDSTSEDERQELERLREKERWVKMKTLEQLESVRQQEPCKIMSETEKAR